VEGKDALGNDRHGKVGVKLREKLPGTEDWERLKLVLDVYGEQRIIVEHE